jgi:hypothetical protein
MTSTGVKDGSEEPHESGTVADPDGPRSGPIRKGISRGPGALSRGWLYAASPSEELAHPDPADYVHNEWIRALSAILVGSGLLLFAVLASGDLFDVVVYILLIGGLILVGWGVLRASWVRLKGRQWLEQELGREFE